jgi:hypothetical protein
MKKFVVLLFVLALSSQLFANISAKQVVGKWKYTIVTDNGDYTGSLKFAEKGGKLTGEVYSDDGGMFDMTKVEIKEGNVLYFELVPEYDPIKITVKIEGKKFKGSGSVNEGEFPLVGEKME